VVELLDLHLDADRRQLLLDDLGELGPLLLPRRVLADGEAGFGPQVTPRSMAAPSRPGRPARRTAAVAAGTIALANTEMSERKGAHGWLSLMTTVDMPCAVTFLIAKSRKPSGPFVLAASRSMEKTTSSAASGVPSENVTPGRS
jgi:hypothetical protein